MDPKEIPFPDATSPTTINETVVRVLGDGKVPTQGVRRARELIHHLSLSVAQTQLLSNDRSRCVPGPAPFPTSSDLSQAHPKRIHAASCTPMDEAVLDLDEAEKAIHICDPWQLEELISNYSKHPSLTNFKAQIGMNQFYMIFVHSSDACYVSQFRRLGKRGRVARS